MTVSNSVCAGCKTVQKLQTAERRVQICGPAHPSPIYATYLLFSLGHVETSILALPTVFSIGPDKACLTCFLQLTTGLLGPEKA